MPNFPHGLAQARTTRTARADNGLGARAHVAQLEGLQRALGLDWQVALGHGLIGALRGYKWPCWARSAWANGVGERGYLFVDSYLSDLFPMLCGLGLLVSLG